METDEQYIYEYISEMIYDELCTKVDADRVWPHYEDNPWNDDFNTVYLTIEFGNGCFKEISMDLYEMDRMFEEDCRGLIELLIKKTNEAKMRQRKN